MSGKKKNVIQAGVVIGVAVALLSVFYAVSIVNEPLLLSDEEAEWHVVDMITPELLITGENSLSGGDSGWLSTFILDYAEDPGTVLANNATDWSAAATARGYVDADDTDTDLASEDPGYFVVRCRFNDSVKDGSDFIGSRCRCTLTVSGDETISGVAQVGDSSDGTGGGVVSQNGTDYIYINFYWDDDSDGYRITDDGSLDWSITVEEKY